MYIKTVRGKFAFGGFLVVLIAVITAAATPVPTQDSYWYWGYMVLVSVAYLGLLVLVVSYLLMLLGDPMPEWSFKGLLSVLQAVGNLLYSDWKADYALTKRTAFSGWQWQKDKGLGNRRSSDVQWRIHEKRGYVMRRVYGDHQVMVHLSKTDDGAIGLVAAAYFVADCEKGTRIETSATYSDGDAYSLVCLPADWGNALGTSSIWDDTDLDDLPRWSQNFDGFKVNENFDSYEWDFQPARRHLTLQSAKP